MSRPSETHSETLEKLPIRKATLPEQCEAEMISAFYSHNADLGCMSNFFKTNFDVPTKLFGIAKLEEEYGPNLHLFNSEQCFMLLKAVIFYGRNPDKNYNLMKAILRTSVPADVKKLGRQLDCSAKDTKFDSETWDAVKTKCMYDACYWKFAQNEDIKAILLGTGDTHLVEATRNDSIWGNGLHIRDENLLFPEEWTGTNLLGEVLMVLREELSQSVE